MLLSLKIVVNTTTSMSKKSKKFLLEEIFAENIFAFKPLKSNFSVKNVLRLTLFFTYIP